MKFGILAKNKQFKRPSVSGIRQRWQRWSIVIPFALQTLVTIGALEYIAHRQLRENTEERVAKLNKADRRVISRLSKYLDKSTGSMSEPERLLELTSFLQQLVSEIAEVDEISLLTPDGSVIASSNRQQLVPLRQLVTQQGDRPLQFTLTTPQQQIVGQIVSLPDSSSPEKWLAVIVAQQPQAVEAIARPNSLRNWYGVYLLPTTLLGFAFYSWLARKLNSVLANKTATTTAEKTSNYIQSSLIADMSHELRSPLNAILGFGQIMQHSLTDRCQRENLAIINRSGKRLLSIVNDIVDLSKIEVNRLGLEQRSFDLHIWLDSIEQSIQVQVRSPDLTFTLTREPNLPQYISLDELRLRQILRNLLDFSLSCSSEGAVKLCVSCDRLSSETESREWLKLRFEVTSTDLIIPPAKLTRLFDPPSQIEEKYHSLGSSLSLPVSRKLARLMGGDITVCQQTLESSEVTLVLTVKAELATNYDLQIQSAPKEIAGLESNQPEYRILIVDDSKTNRKIMVQLLERVGFKVREAVNGKEAVDIWLHWQPHMIWMDLRMPVMNGYEATSQIRSRSPSQSPAIVALTASTSLEERSLFRESGCNDFVGKPFSENIIFDKIAQHLGVRYIYQANTPPKIEDFQLTVNSLQIMSDSWLDTVEQAAASLDAELLTHLLQQIPTEHSELRNALQQQVDDFDFDKILNLIEQSKSQST